MNTDHPLAATLAQIHRLSLDGTLAERLLALAAEMRGHADTDHCASKTHRLILQWAHGIETCAAIAEIPGGGGGWLANVKRYDISIGGGCDCCGTWLETDECADGDWVRFKDIEAALSPAPTPDEAN